MGVLDSMTVVMPKKRWTPWMGACWTAGNSGFKWPVMDAHRLLTEADTTAVAGILTMIFFSSLFNLKNKFN